MSQREELLMSQCGRDKGSDSLHSAGYRQHRALSIVIGFFYQQEVGLSPPTSCQMLVDESSNHHSDQPEFGRALNETTPPNRWLLDFFASRRFALMAQASRQRGLR